MEKEQILSNVDQIFEWAKNTAETVSNFAAEQTPLFVQEMINWIFWDNMITAGVIFFSLAIVAGIFIKYVKILFGQELTDSLDGANIFLGIVAIAVWMVIFCLGVVAPSKQAVKAVVAPRVVVVEKISEYIKK